MSAPPLRAPELIDALNDGGVEYVVIGGFSLAAHGVVRGTKDIDIVPNPSRANLARLAAVLKALHAEHHDVGDFSGGGNFVLRTSLGRLDVMQEVKGVASYEDLHARAASHRVRKVKQPALFASFRDLLRMKAAAGRPQDEIDIGDLKAARGGLRPDEPDTSG